MNQKYKSNKQLNLIELEKIEIAKRANQLNCEGCPVGDRPSYAARNCAALLICQAEGK